MDTNDEEYDVEELVRNKETGYSRMNPQSGPQKRKEISTFNCQVCEKKFNKSRVCHGSLRREIYFSVDSK